MDVHTLDDHPAGWHHVHTLDDHPGGWHTNRVSWRAILVSHLPFWCPNPNRFEPTGCAPRVKRKGGLQGGWCAVLCCTVAFCPATSSSNNTELVLRCCTVALLCCAALLCFCFGPSSSYNTELLHRWVDTLSSNPTVTTLSCYTTGLNPTAYTVRLHFEGPA